MGTKDHGSSSGGTKSHYWKINGPKKDNKITGGRAKLLCYVTLEKEGKCSRKTGSQEPGQGRGWEGT